MEFNLHIGAHSHMDLGWLKTYNEYSSSKFLNSNLFSNEQNIQKCDSSSKVAKKENIFSWKFRVFQNVFGYLSNIKTRSRKTYSEWVANYFKCSEHCEL